MYSNNFICKWWCTIFPPKNIKRIDMNEEYIHNTKIKFLKLYDHPNYTSFSSNIESIIYDKKKLTEVLSDSNNHLEKIWKTRIMIEKTPIGNIVMFYDIYKQGFSYYCDQPIVAYDILNSVAMKYVMRFWCLDFFMDEYIIPCGIRSPLKTVFLEEEKVKKPGSNIDLAIDLKNAPFAKLKNYTNSKKDRNTIIKTPVYFRTNYPWFWKLWYRIQYYIVLPIYKAGTFVFRYIVCNNCVNPKSHDVSMVVKNESEQSPEKIRNKFIYLGRFRNFNTLQSIVKKNGLNGGGSSKYDAMFHSSGKAISYKAFKMAQ